MPSIAAPSSGLFGRFSSRRQARELQDQQEQGQGQGHPQEQAQEGEQEQQQRWRRQEQERIAEEAEWDVATPVPSPSIVGERGAPPPPLQEQDPQHQHQYQYRSQPVHQRQHHQPHRVSSSLSGTSNVSDLSHIVRRSASLRSDRSQPSSTSDNLAHASHSFVSSSSASTADHAAVPSAPTISLTTSAVDEHSHPAALDEGVPPPPRSRGKLSMSARSLSSRFKSTDALPTLSQSDLSDLNDLVSVRQGSVADGSKPSLAAGGGPPAPRRAPPDRPGVQPQRSFARDLPAGAPLQHTTTAPAAQSGSHNPQAVYVTIHETSMKRIATIDYMRKVHEGHIFYFGALNYSPAQLSSLPSLQPVKLSRRANSYMVLGYSLSNLVDIHSGDALEYLKALSSLLPEFEVYQTLSGFDSSGSSLSRGRVGQMFSSMGLGTRAGKGRRSSAAPDTGVSSLASSNGSTDYLGISNGRTNQVDVATSPLEASTGHDFQHLVTPHLPFDPDFSAVFASFCDTLVEMYAKLRDLVQGPEQCVPGVGEAFSKVDKAIRKILVANVVREFEDSSRGVAKGEVAGLGRLVMGGLM